jgi:ligand-binding sensor domain-containing protein
MIKILSFIALYLIVASVPAQEVPGVSRFEHVTIADGLPVNSANCIIQDHLGFIWLGTFGGLVRYDGANVVALSHNPDDPNSFQGKVVVSMMEDNNGDIWIGSESLFRFERSSQRFIEYPDKNSKLKDGYPEIRFIHQDKQGRIWTIRYINNQYLLARFDLKTSSWVYFNNDPGNPHHLEGNGLFSNFLKFSFVEGPDGKIWVTTIGKTENSLLWLDPGTDSFVPYHISSGSGVAGDFKKICGLSSGKKGLLYLSTDYYLKGWFILNPQNGQIKQFKHDERDTNSLLNDSAISFPFEDKAGFIWLSTLRGIDRFNPSTNVHTHYISKTTDPSTPIPGPFLLESETPGGDIWFMGSSQMSFYDQKKNRFFSYTEDEKEEAGLWGFLSSTFVDASGMAWFGTYSSGLNKESRINKFPLLRNIPNNVNSLQDATVNTIYEAPSEPGTIWFGTKTGLDQFDKKTGIFKHYRHSEYDRGSISKGNVTAIAEDKNNRFWVGTNGGGLNLMDRKKARFVHFVKDSQQVNGLNDNYISCLKPASDSSLWIGTNGAGLDHFDYNHRKFDHYLKADTNYTPELYNLINLYTGPDREKLAVILHPGDNVNISAPFEIKEPARILVSGLGEITGTNNEDWGWIEDSAGNTVWEMNIANTFKDGFQDARIRVGIISLHPGKYQLRYKSDPHYSYGHWNGPPPYHPELWGIQAILLNPGEALDLDKELAKRYYNGLGSDYVNSITEDANKNLWIGLMSVGGLSEFNPRTGKFKSYIDISKGPVSITGSILEDKKTGNIWAGDFAFGLLLLNKSGQILKKYNHLNGLPSNTIQGILQDEKGILWISTDNGLCRFDTATQRFQLFNKKNGLQGLVFNSMAFFKSADGEFFFGGANGVNAFYPDQIKLDTNSPKLVLTDLDISGGTGNTGRGGANACPYFNSKRHLPAL